MLEFYLLEQLAAFAQYGTLSAAGEALNLSQSALSRSMQKLESELGVGLFERQKNKIALNETGRLAARYAQGLLEQERDMTARVRAFDRSRRTISLGCCAPVPQAELVSLLSQLYEGMTVSSELKSDGALLEGLEREEYQLVVLHQSVEERGLCCQPCGRERLYLAVPPTHPLARRDGVYLADLSGQSLLIYTQIGFWHDLCMEKIRDPRLLYQSDREILNELVYASALPCFVTDVTMARFGVPDNRVAIPLLDEEADAAYYLVCRQADRKRFAPLLRRYGG